MKKFALIASFWMWSISVAFATESFEDRFLNLGVDEDFTIMERGLIKDQVKNFMDTYQRITQQMFKDMPKYSSIIMNLNSSHQIKNIRYRYK